VFVVQDENLTEMVDKLLEEKESEKKPSETDESKKEIQPIKEWIKTQNFQTTKEIKVP